jgi:hypothetical protein
LANQHKVIVDTPPADERALSTIHQLWHARRETQGKQLSDELSERVHQANRPEVLDVDCALLLRPGPDGFSWEFFRHCWPIIQSDVTEAVRAIFVGRDQFFAKLNDTTSSNFIIPPYTICEVKHNALKAAVVTSE